MNSFYTSTSSLYSETIRIQQYIQNKFHTLVFNPFLLENDIDYKSYCSHYKELKRYSNGLPENSDFELIKQKFAELPNLDSKDFEFSTFGIPFYLLCILFPLNAISWGKNYSKLSALKESFTDVTRHLGTIIFMLKATIN